jgi:hypothetical protein
MQMNSSAGALMALALCAPAAVGAQELFAGAWKTDPEQPAGLGTTVTYSTSVKGGEHYSNNRNREYDFAMDGHDYPTDRPGATVRWDRTGSSSWTSVEKIEGKVTREIQLSLSADDQTLTSTYTWFNPASRTAKGSAVFSRVAGTSGIEGTWRVVKRVEEPDTLTIFFPAPGQLHLNIDPIDYTWTGSMDGAFRPVHCPMLSPGTTSAFQLAGARRMNSETKVNGTTVSVDKWEISEDGKKLSRTIWAPGHEDKTLVLTLKRQ